MTDFNTDEFVQSLIGKSPFEIYKAVHKLDKEMGKGYASSVLQQSDEFGQYCARQMKAFLENRVALTQRDADHVDSWWKFSLIELSSKEIDTVKDKASQGLFIRSDRFIDMDADANFQKIVKNIPDIQEEMDLPSSEETDLIRRNQRQKIVDFFRFASSGRKVADLIQADNWSPLRKEFNHFPKMPIQLITKLLDGVTKYNQENPKEQKIEREALLTRIFIYRLDDICTGAWKPNAEEIYFLEDYLKNLNMPNNDTVVETLNKLNSLKENLQQKPDNQKPEEVAEQTNPVGQTTISFEEDDEEGENNTSVHETPTPVEENSVEPTSEQNRARLVVSEGEEESLPENILSVSELDNSDKDEQENEEDITNSLSGWRKETLSSWKKWGEKNNKVVQAYKSDSPTALTFKVYNSTENVKKDEFEADVTYRKKEDIVVKGKNGKVPSDEFFTELVAQAKKNGPEIRFGNIKNPVFKAKLMLACLNDPKVKMVNPPKIEDLTDIPEDLRLKLEDKLSVKAASDRVRNRKEDLQEEKTGRSKSKDKKGKTDKPRTEDKDKKKRKTRVPDEKLKRSSSRRERVKDTVER